MEELKVQKRDILGSKVRQLRADGLVPAELYGAGVPNVHLSVPVDEFNTIYKEAGEHSIININIDGDVRHTLIQNIQVNPITDEMLSIDFRQVKMDEKVITRVPLSFEGEAPAVKLLGGVLVKVADEVEVEALPADLPSNIVVDVSALEEFDQNIHVKDIPKIGKFEFITDPDTVVATVSAPREEEVEEEVEEEITAEDVVVEGEEKREEEKEKQQQEDN